MHFGVHFPKENVQQRVHFPKENVQHHIFLCEMFSITFCFAEHFPKENVQHQQNVRAAQKTPNTAFLQCLPCFLYSKKT